MNLAGVRVMDRISTKISQRELYESVDMETVFGSWNPDIVEYFIAHGRMLKSDILWQVPYVRRYGPPWGF